MTDADAIQRELNHRVQNSLQIMVSLMNLKKRTLPPEQRNDIRFLQEHVQSIAVACRLAYASAGTPDVAIGELFDDVVGELRLFANLPMDQVRMSGAPIQIRVSLDRAIAFGLYLAVLLPPYMDYAHQFGKTVALSTLVEDELLTLSVEGNCSESDVLRSRLHAAYGHQLQVETLPSPDGSSTRYRIPIT